MLCSHSSARCFFVDFPVVGCHLANAVASRVLTISDVLSGVGGKSSIAVFSLQQLKSTNACFNTALLYHLGMARNPPKAFLKAIAVFGSGAAMARAIKKPAQFINQIKKGDRPMPDAWAPLIENATAGLGKRVLCEELAPNFPWSLVRPTTQKEAAHG